VADRKKSYFWHVPPGGWGAISPATPGVSSIGGDVVIVLVDGESGPISAHPEIDNFVVERIVGQYMIMMHALSPPPLGAGVHSRVYVADADVGSVGVRDLESADDAETSFLWHQVDAVDGDANNEPFGNWATLARPATDGVGFMGRHGHLDIRVGRRVEGGQALLWHSQFNPTAVDTAYSVKLWVRLLVREA